MSSSSGRWRAGLSTMADGFTTAGNLEYYVVATDRGAPGKPTRLPAGTATIQVKACNLLPVFKDGSGRSSPAVSFDGSAFNAPAPPGVPACPILNAFILVYVSDPDSPPDALTSVTFYYRPHGATTDLSVNLTYDPASGSAYADLTKITSGWPTWSGTGTATIPWYVTARDALGGSRTRKSTAPVELSGNAVMTESPCP